MAAVELVGDRVAGNTSILARDDGSFWDFNGSVNYRNVSELLKAFGDLESGDGKYTPPAGINTNLTHSARDVTTAAQRFRSSIKTASLDEYLPFYSWDRIQSNVGTTYSGDLAVMMWRPTTGGAPRGTQYGLCQYRGSTKAKWMSIKGSDSKVVESLVQDRGPVYTTFGMGDFLLLKSTGLNYMCFGGDGASRNSPYVNYMKAKVGTRDIRLIADNDSSGKSTADYLRSYGFTVKVFNWKKLGELAKPKMDLRDLAWVIKSRDGDFSHITELISKKDLYV